MAGLAPATSGGMASRRMTGTTPAMTTDVCNHDRIVE
jgi:hypothetical protein